MTQQLTSSFRNFFARYSSGMAPSRPKARGNLYELYVYTKVCEAVSQHHSLQAINLSGTGSFTFRCSPGYLSTRFSHFRLVSGAHRFEIHNGLRVQGYLTDHEVDVSVLTTPLPQLRMPHHSSLRIALECKFYKSSSSLKGEGRKNLGAVIDCTHASHPIPPMHAQIGCIHCGIGFTPAFVTNITTAGSAGILSYLRGYGLNPMFEVFPGSSGENRLMQFLNIHVQNL